MTEVDPTKDVETEEDHPRPVRVLFDKDGRPEAAYIADNGSSPSFNLFALEHIGTGISATRGMYSIPLRNVAPPKPEPVLREVWPVWDKTGCVHGNYPTQERAREVAGNIFGVYARAAVMSDGSRPVPSEASGEKLNVSTMSVLRMEKQGLEEQRDHWKAKDEALQAEVDKRNDSILDHLDRIQAMKPVVDAAVAWAEDVTVNSDNKLCRAVRAYQSKQAPAEPVKNCTTCAFNAPIQVGAPCVKCHYANEWMPRHD